jgi:hypothetical protein
MNGLVLSLPEARGTRDVVCLLGALACMIGCAHPEPPPASRPSIVTPQIVPSAPAAAVRRNGCVVHGALPDPKCTPGTVMTVDLDVICQQSTNGRRQVSAAVHRQAFADYGLAFPQPHGAFEVDHLIPLELGGDNAIENLWPEAAEPRPGFHEKDRVENYLHEKVCAGKVSLSEAQRLIATDWLAVWTQIRRPR